MGKIAGFFGKNWIYAAMTVFILAINLLIIADKALVEKADKEKQAASQQVPAADDQAKAKAEEESEKKPPTVFPSDDEVKARQDKLTDLAEKNPKLYMFFGLMNIFIFYVILAGIIIDIVFIVKFFRRKPVQLDGIPHIDPKWGFGDVVRVVLIFLTSGYLFVIFQAFAAKSLPILYNDNFRMVFNTFMMNLVGISVIVYFVHRKYGQDIKAIGLTARGAARNVLYAVTGYIALIPVLLVIMIVTFYVTRLFKYEPPVQPIVQVFMEEKQTMVLWISTIFAAVFGPVAEEIFFRGFMYPVLRKGLGVFWGMMIVSAVFSFLHAHIVGFLPIFALGLLLVWLYEKTGSLVTCMAVHIMHNVAMVVLVFVVRSIGV